MAGGNPRGKPIIDQKHMLVLAGSIPAYTFGERHGLPQTHDAQLDVLGLRDRDRGRQFVLSGAGRIVHGVDVLADDSGLAWLGAVSIG